jgi:hypothetical protein
MRTALLLGYVLLVATALDAQAPATTQGIDVTPKSGVIHGTVDVVVSTKEGFVLATDSRATKTVGLENSFTDDAQKLYTIGDRAACVVAGLIGSEIGSSGFELRDTIGTNLRLMDQSARQRNSPSTAQDVADSFEFGLSRVTGLLAPNIRASPGLIGQVSAVSVNPDGTAEWVSFELPLEIIPNDSGQIALAVGRPIYHWHAVYLGPRFDVDVLGQPEIAIRMLSAQGPTTDHHTQTTIMRRYYWLKKWGRLDQLTLREGVSLARELVQSTIDLSPPTAGVGGPIDIAVVTRNGVRWVQRKQTFASLPRPHYRVFDSQVPLQDLDDFECVRCDFTDARLFYAGDADVQLVNSKFGGSCRLALAPDAEQKNPEATARLKALMQGKCRIVVQDSNFP